ncbi:acyl-CoA thioesterase [Roseiconus lacunae]|uniref:acyl-CoA thioesterase n=1 Tax=Roseiconus lacunae TaxID=2605694 RepID=UPI0011F354F7|nr:acyl-CoA thioesterase [Roseiconus lacunae]MCD0460888.1 acyl-CoA thioesterase [Roseiconus lacunae]WRQ48733.1 acyl-CoA thioesterase [Stieleria sp. HD01]
MNDSPPGNPTSAFPYFDLSHHVADDEIDAQQHVHNLRYLQWSLWAAGKHTAAIGWDAQEALARNVGWVVREHSIQYRVAALAGDDIVVRTWVADLQRFASRRKYVIFRPADRAVLARIETRWVFVDLQRHKVMPIPDEARQSLTILDQPPPLPWENQD